MSHFEIHYDTQSQAMAAEIAFADRAEGQLQVRRLGNRVQVTPPPLVAPLVALLERLCRISGRDCFIPEQSAVQKSASRSAR
ncbi:hypothetical protein [Motiliproteus coralliicola]|uniref:hypothetical protein n=1 Tax=Motiliproteus coralliicola TaxID=2283196 RepID=UPI000E091905|nr:hypothetical protein [Motiliproteus coralliicola]